ncbi:hypothetical protein BGZ61DRAFT_483279 [Ilyonectria robusta]|uniref:uncharacterized protein n=1 Tax=Ilyonectria robusta TaxID=1079257 RepID=UPI001E8E2B2E|nr:uncharacterized protein BGZ61DRAFT_483279 [Ilyonectria robusta]KAH8669983.1 hypothetical protein BGZ61DRAFT_483279 [Ilyonectria robusta]
MLQTTSTLLIADRSWISSLPSTSPIFTSWSYNQLPPKIGRKKEALKEILDQVEELDYDDPELVGLHDESEQLDEPARGFQHSALSTQLKQNRHLVLYQRWTNAVFGDVDDEDLDQACFPDLEDGARPLRKLFFRCDDTLRLFSQSASPELLRSGLSAAVCWVNAREACRSWSKESTPSATSSLHPML